MGRIDKKLGIALGIVAVVIAVFVIVNVHSPNKLTLWYTNDKITAFLNKVATEYEASTGVDIECKLITDAMYYEKIYKEGKKGPDIFIGRNSDLEKVFTYDLSKDISNKTEILNESNYPKAAIESVGYNEKIWGFPFTFETAVLYYNDKYITKVPSSIDELKEFSSADVVDYDGDNIIEFDVSSLLSTYPFVGDSLTYYDEELGLDYENSEFLAALSYYQNMNETFLIDADKISESVVISDFIGENTAYILGSTNYISRLNKGGEDFSYKISEIPKINDDMDSKPLSVTSALFINKQSGNVAKAIDFAEYISFDKKNEIFEMLGVMPAAYPDKENEDLMAVYEQYNNSRIISKEVENSEILSELEIILRRVWSGENISDVIKEYE